MPGAYDLSDVARVTPHVLRRARMTARLSPSLTGHPKALVADRPPLERVVLWAGAVAAQAAASEERLAALRSYIAETELALAGVRRPQPLRRAVWAALDGGVIWAASLARLTGVDIANSWRTLRQAAAKGLLLPLPAARRSRGDAHVLVAPPLARAAGLLPAPRLAGRRRTHAAATPHGLAKSLSDLEAASAAIDALLRRSASPADP